MSEQSPKYHEAVESIIVTDSNDSNRGRVKLDAARELAEAENSDREEIDKIAMSPQHAETMLRVASDRRLNIAIGAKAILGRIDPEFLAMPEIQNALKDTAEKQAAAVVDGESVFMPGPMRESIQDAVGSLDQLRDDIQASNHEKAS